MIAFDFDGVISDTHHIFRGHIFDKFGVVIGKEAEQTTYEFVNFTTDSQYEPWWWDEIPVAITKYQHICPPYAGAIRALNAMYIRFDMQHVQIITAREPSKAVMQVTKLWCQQNFTFPYQIDFCASPEEKTDLIGFYDIKYYIDDRFKTAQDLSPHLKYSYLLNQHWNARNNADLNSNVVRVNSIWQMKNHLETVV